VKILVQKFGGTSVGSPEGLRSIVEIVTSSLKTHRVVAVVSAVSSRSKSEGTTSLLLEACRLAVCDQDFAQPLERIQSQHLELIAHAIRSEQLKQSIVAFLNERLEWTRNFLAALRIVKDLSPQSHDAVICIGEQLSAHIVAAALSEGGIPAEPRELLSAVEVASDVLDQRFFSTVASQLADRCLPGARMVPVATGFFGPVPGGLLKRIGRGYSDLTAALIASGFGSHETEELQIWKEVDGVFSADPKKVASAQVLSTLSAHEASELTSFGSEVIHPYTMEQVIGVGIPIRVKNTLKPGGEGSLIVPELSRTAKNATAVTAKSGVSVAMVRSSKMYEARGFLAGVFEVMRDLDISVDLVSTSEVSISFTVEDHQSLERSRAALEQFGEVTILKNRAIIAVVGEGLRGYAGSAGKLFTALGEHGINVEMISQGISETNISCVVSESDIENALRAAHGAFFE